VDQAAAGEGLQRRLLPIHPYTDLSLHHMGPGLADGSTQGLAGGNEFHTAPLRGIGQWGFFLHEGRTPDLLQAILVAFQCRYGL